jgi:hypothetical protein
MISEFLTLVRKPNSRLRSAHLQVRTFDVLDFGPDIINVTSAPHRPWPAKMNINELPNSSRSVRELPVSCSLARISLENTSRLSSIFIAPMGIFSFSGKKPPCNSIRRSLIFFIIAFSKAVNIQSILFSLEHGKQR